MPPRTVRIAPAHVRELRRLRGYPTQIALADASGVDQSTVSRMERLAGPYDLEKVRKIAEALEVEDLRILGVPEEDVVALEAAASLRARLARLVGLHGDPVPERRPTRGPRKRPVVADLAHGVA
ncbi:MAG TPA: helix-turn-helix transcriptional regulator [Streptosporangiaceae bacterium]|nr:helix-turn-helix transcriptional regulator [Streptosporangiaceae bacterium]